MSTTPRPSGTSSGPSPNKMILMVLGIVGGVIVLCVGVALVYYVATLAVSTVGSGVAVTAVPTPVPTTKATGTPTNVQARQAADAFLRELLSGQVERAHGMTTTDFQREVPYVEFRAYYEGTPQLKGKPTLQSLVVLRQVPEGVYYRGTVNGPNGSVTFSLDVVQENFEWKVGRFKLDQ